MPSYDHAPFIGEAIGSVMDQTFSDFELIVCDDASTDNTREVVNGFTDSRVKSLFFENNREHNMRLEGLRIAEGEYISLLNSDDKFERTKLEKQLAYLEEHQEVVAVFTRVLFIDEKGEMIRENNGNPLHGPFTCGTRNRFEWLAKFFFEGNCLCHPSVLMRRDALIRAGSYNPNFAQMADLDLWIRLCFLGEMHVIDEELTFMRWFKGNKNLSAPRRDSHNRSAFEYSKLLRHYTNPFVIDNFRSIFTEYQGNDTIADKLLYLVKTAYGSNVLARKIFAADLFYDLLSDQETLTELKKRDPSVKKEFFAMVGNTDFSSWMISKERKDNRELNRELSAIRNSFSWKLGRTLTWPIRFLYNSLKR